MGWTNPRTWVTNEIVTAAIMNAHVRDNLNAINGFVTKTADEQVSSSVTLQNDDHLFYAIPGAGTFIVEVDLYASSVANNAGDMLVGFSFPAGTMHFGLTGPDAALASGTIQTGQFAAFMSATSGVTAWSLGLSTSPVMLRIHGILTATAAGTLRLIWAQAVSNANASKVLAGSHMLVQQVA